jgi:hypothetical protein
LFQAVRLLKSSQRLPCLRSQYSVDGSRILALILQSLLGLPNILLAAHTLSLRSAAGISSGFARITGLR